MEIKVLIEAPELVSAITGLAYAIRGKDLASIKDPAVISDAEAAETLSNGDDPTKYTMFQEMAKAAQELKDADPNAYKTVLSKYVEPGKKYSAIQPKDWGKAKKEFKEVLADLSMEEEEESNVAKKTMYYYYPESDEVGIIKAGEELLEDVTYLSKADYLKKKKELEAAEVEEDDDDYEEAEEMEAPRLSAGELRKLAAKAKNAGVAVGPLMKKITGVTKVSSIPEEKYNAFEDALRKAMEE